VHFLMRSCLRQQVDFLFDVCTQAMDPRAGARGYESFALCMSLRVAACASRWIFYSMFAHRPWIHGLAPAATCSAESGEL
jgi:hypothetical protein